LLLSIVTGVSIVSVSKSPNRSNAVLGFCALFSLETFFAVVCGTSGDSSPQSLSNFININF
jgi:hypothetical protein